ncbi:D-aminoacylase [Pochonia chlamydosporia 170]|uniref:D-aminoacylase n=1 Tax=Pochonia chlamydosporia 170 TaxID=1380566 RepID=A0A179G072_METCM|nr:D-aminoacylase [Pochonia chlamydosporia 170]OAQ71282.1 D-aminoacylase [Pochonia chlamydosporia 170]
MATDILFTSPTVITGEESATPFVADVLICNGLIAQISEPGVINPPSGARVIDAKGYVLSPGFIDMHAHSDLYLLTNPDHEAKITQGCTTEVVGQDGISYAPVRNNAQLQAIRDQIAGWNGNPTDEECATLHKGVGMFEWRTVGEYLDCLERNKTATNVAMLVPQGNLRLLACGPHDSVATEAEIQDQVALLREAMDQGAVGMSSGLTYTPGMYASTSELGILCKALSEYPGAFYAPHHRSYGFKAIESYAEMLDLGSTTGCPVHLTHATLNFAENRGKAPLLMGMIDEKLAAGVDVTLDTYPYLPGCTTLAALIPSWASSGGPAETLKRLEDPETRERIRVAVEETGCDGGHGIPTNWDEIQIGTTSHPSIASYSGQRVSAVAKSQNKPPHEIFFEVLTKDRLSTSCLMHIGNEPNVQAIMQHRVHMSGSDAILHGKTTHPRAYGTFTRYLGHYSRELGLLSLPDMVAHLTSRPARRLGVFPGRGVVRVGSAADLVLFDAERVRDRATFEEPKLRSEGVRFVLVNGVVALEEGEMVGVRAGRVLRRRDGRVS